MKRIFILAVLLIPGICMFAFAQGIPATIIGQGLHVRTEPWGSKTDVLSPSTSFTVTGAKMARHPQREYTAVWYSIQYSGTKTGWVHSGFVQVSGSPPTPEPLPPDPPQTPPPGLTPLKMAAVDAEKALTDYEPPTTPGTLPPTNPTDTEVTTKPADYPGTGPTDDIVAWEWHFLKDDTGKPRTMTWYKNFNDWTLMRKLYPQPPWEYKNSNPIRRSGKKE